MNGTTTSMRASSPTTGPVSDDFQLPGGPLTAHVRTRSTSTLLPWLLLVFTLALSLAPSHAHEVAILKSANITAYNQAVSSFKSSMPPDTAFIEYDLKGDTHAGRIYAGKIRASGADLVLAVGSKAAIAARLEIFDIPVVYSMVLHPGKYDLTSPNLVGIPAKPAIGPQLETLRTIMPNMKRIGYVFDPDKTSALEADALARARYLGLTFIERQVRTAEQVPAALRELLPKIDALWLISDSTVLTEESFAFLLREAFDRHIPIIGFDPEFSRRGALVSFWIDSTDIGRQAAYVANTLLAGLSGPPSHIPQPRQRMALNLGTAEYLGIAISPAIQRLADEAY